MATLKIPTDQLKSQLQDLLQGILGSAERAQTYTTQIWPNVLTAIETNLQLPTPSTATTIRGLLGAIAMKAAREVGISSYSIRAKLKEAVVSFVHGVLVAAIVAV